jgi:hypothetical protein
MHLRDDGRRGEANDAANSNGPPAPVPGRGLASGPRGRAGANGGQVPRRSGLPDSQPGRATGSQTLFEPGTGGTAGRAAATLEPVRSNGRGAARKGWDASRPAAGGRPKAGGTAPAGEARVRRLTPRRRASGRQAATPGMSQDPSGTMSEPSPAPVFKTDGHSTEPSDAPMASDVVNSQFACGFAQARQSRPLPTPEPAEQTDPDVARLVAAWPTLPDPIRRAMLALLDAGSGHSDQ